MDGNIALVGMTSIFSLEDEIIPLSPISSRLDGASNVLIQSPEICGPLHVVDHFLGMPCFFVHCITFAKRFPAPFDNGYFGVVLDALANGGFADTDRFDKTYCAGSKGNTSAHSSNLFPCIYLHPL